MATIQIVTAKSGLNVGERHFGRSRSYNIYVDGTKAGTVPNGQRQSFPVKAGAHSIFAKTDMSWRSPDIFLDIKENGSKVFYVQPSPKRIWIIALLFHTILLTYILGATKAPGYFHLLSLVIVLILAFAVWRKPGLTIAEILE